MHQPARGRLLLYPVAGADEEETTQGPLDETTKIGALIERVESRTR